MRDRWRMSETSRGEIGPRRVLDSASKGARVLLASVLLTLAPPRPGLAQPRPVETIPATSGLQVQNLELELRTTIVTGLHAADGAEQLALLRPSVERGAAANVYLPAEPSVPSGSHAARLASEGRLGVLVRTDDRAPDRGAEQAAAALYRQPDPSETVLVPLALKRYRGQSSRLSVQNASAEEPLRARLSLVPLGGTEALAQLDLSLPPAGSQRVDLAGEPALATLPDEFLGYARIEAEGGGSLAAVSHVDVADQARGIYALEGLPVEEADRRVLLPRIRHTPPRVSGIAVVNAGAEPAVVSLRYHALPGPSACGPEPSWSHQAEPTRLRPGQQQVFYAAAPGPDGRAVVPPGCQGWAELRSEGGALLAAVVEAEVDTAGRPSRAGAYAGIGEARAGSLVFLPLFRRRHLRQEISTPLSLVNPGDAPAELRIEVRDMCEQPVACGLGCSLRLAPGEGQLWHPDALPEPSRRCGTGPGFYGSAVVESDRPLALVAFEEPRLGGGDFVAFDALRRPDDPRPPNGRFFEALLPAVDCLLPPESRSVGCR